MSDTFDPNSANAPQGPGPGSDPAVSQPQGFGPPAGQVPPQGYPPQPGQIPPQGYAPPPGQIPPPGYAPPGQVPPYGPPPQGYGPPQAGAPMPKKKLSGAMLGALIGIPVVVIIVVAVVLVFALGGDDEKSGQHGSLRTAAESATSDLRNLGDNPDPSELKGWFTTWVEKDCSTFLNMTIDMAVEQGGFDDMLDGFGEAIEGESKIKSVEENGDEGTVVFEESTGDSTTYWAKHDGAWQVSCKTFFDVDQEIPSFDDYPTP